MLELRNLVKCYPVGRGEPIRAVDGVSMSIAPGEFVSLYGPSGSGKSTLLKLIDGTLRPDAGTILLDGRDVLAMRRRELDDYRLRELGVVGQPHNLLSGARAIDNASLKLLLTHSRKQGLARVKGLLAQLGLEDRMWHRTDELSMGERQRVLIAMALAAGPRLVLADEPTGSLDTRMTRSVLRQLRELCVEQDVALLLATHDPLAVGFADRVYELRDGRLGEYNPEQVLVAPGSLREGA